ncbi:MAG: hypothetical protein K9M94_14990 [Spirochaetia bacterium]|nr:hypothetical protein [Spirochaetia bacterium]
MSYFVFYLSAAVGFLSGEIRAITWEQIDLTVGTIDITRAWKDPQTNVSHEKRA